MYSKEAVLEALEEGKTLTNTITGSKYMLIQGKLHIRSMSMQKWEPSDLSFFNPPSWLNLELLRQ